MSLCNVEGHQAVAGIVASSSWQLEISQKSLYNVESMGFREFAKVLAIAARASIGCQPDQGGMGGVCKKGILEEKSLHILKAETMVCAFHRITQKFRKKAHFPFKAPKRWSLMECHYNPMGKKCKWARPLNASD